MAYATAGDLTTWLGSTPSPADATRLLARASTVIDSALIGAVYATDTSKMPTDATVIAAMRDATTAQIEWWMATQDELGQFDLDHKVSVTVAGISRERMPGLRSRLSPRGLEILHLAKLLPRKATV